MDTNGNTARKIMLNQEQNYNSMKDDVDRYIANQQVKAAS
jgi:hypothetical protein